MVSTLDSGSRCPESVCYALGQDTLLSQCLSQHRYINAGRQPYDGLASHGGGGGGGGGEMEILLVTTTTTGFFMPESRISSGLMGH